MTKRGLSYKERRRLLKKIGAKEWTGWYRDDIKWSDLPAGVRKALLDVKKAEKVLVRKKRKKK